MWKTNSIADDVSLNSNTTGVNSGTGYTYPSGVHQTTPRLCWFPVAQCLVFLVVFCRSLFVLLFCFAWSLYCLYLFDLRFLITPLWYFQTFLNSNTKRVISGTGTDNSSAIPEYTSDCCGFVLFNIFCVDNCLWFLSFYVCWWYCFSFFYLRFLVTIPYLQTFPLRIFSVIRISCAKETLYFYYLVVSIVIQT
jgi:hypothetical protein